ncbi:hypothetical protein MTP99_016267 [Tenebrio molitor]|nr:hypothetical protein MTP99_016267 [Tenebrio molitor]
MSVLPICLSAAACFTIVRVCMPAGNDPGAAAEPPRCTRCKCQPEVASEPGRSSGGPPSRSHVQNRGPVRLINQSSDEHLQQAHLHYLWKS